MEASVPASASVPPPAPAAAAGYSPSSRDGLLVIGIISGLAAIRLYNLKMLRPFQAAFVISCPTLGVAVMETVITNTEPVTRAALNKADEGGEKSDEAREASAILARRLKLLVK